MLSTRHAVFRPRRRAKAQCHGRRAVAKIPRTRFRYVVPDVDGWSARITPVISRSQLAAFTGGSLNSGAGAREVPGVCRVWARLWSGRRESNPHIQLGKLSFYH